MKRSRGFSLIELLTVLAVLAVVTTIGTTMFFKVNDLWRKTTIRGQLDDTVARVDKELGRDLGMTLSSTLSGVAIQGVRREAEVAVDLAAVEADVVQRQDDDWVIIPVEEVDLKSLQPRRYNVLYRVQRASEEALAGTLVRESFALDGAVPEEVSGMPLASGVQAVRAQYYDGEAWRDAWSEGHNPEAVRVTLVLQDEARPWEQVARMLSYPVHVK